MNEHESERKNKREHRKKSRLSEARSPPGHGTAIEADVLVLPPRTRKEACLTQVLTENGALLPPPGGPAMQGLRPRESRAGYPPGRARQAPPRSPRSSAAVFASCSGSMVARRISRAARRALRCICCEDMADIRMREGFAVYWAVWHCRVAAAFGGAMRANL